jgi:hypothetical protein
MSTGCQARATRGSSVVRDGARAGFERCRCAPHALRNDSRGSTRHEHASTGRRMPMPRSAGCLFEAALVAPRRETVEAEYPGLMWCARFMLRVPKDELRDPIHDPRRPCNGRPITSTRSPSSSLRASTTGPRLRRLSPRRASTAPFTQRSYRLTATAIGRSYDAGDGRAAALTAGRPRGTNVGAAAATGFQTAFGRKVARRCMGILSTTIPQRRIPPPSDRVLRSWS